MKYMKIAAHIVGAVVFIVLTYELYLYMIQSESDAEKYAIYYFEKECKKKIGMRCKSINGPKFTGIYYGAYNFEWTEGNEKRVLVSVFYGPHYAQIWFLD
jgi:hypothetical protein